MRHLKDLTKLIKTAVIDIPQLMAQYFDMQCSHCDVQFNGLEDAQYHYHENHGKVRGYVKCCGRQFRGYTRIRDHLLWHVHMERFKCPVCSVQLYTLYGFKRHYSVIHTPEYMTVRENRVQCVHNEKILLILFCWCFLGLYCVA